jgi:PPOX class probable F420-dependent enzyme
MTAAFGESRPRVPDSHRDILEKTGVAQVATVGPDGGPQTNPVWYRWEDESLIFSTTKSRQKYRNVRRTPLIAACLVDPDDAYHYLELRGRAEVEDDPDGSLVHALAKKYTGTESFEGDLRNRVIVRLVPARVLVY